MGDYRGGSDPNRGSLSRARRAGPAGTQLRAVADLSASRNFYEKLGFQTIGGDASKNWLILQNGISTIGLFQGMFENNIMTFNPGWTHKQENLEDFDDVREIQSALEDSGLQLTSRADDSTDGPASLMLLDPDGNTVLIDQHVPRPGTA